MAIPSDGRAFVAEGTVEEKYAGMTRMYVGILQLTRNSGKLDISGAAYGMGAPEWKTGKQGDPDGWEDGPQTSQGTTTRLRRWAMELRGDYEHPLHPGSAVGFVLGEMPGGKVTGWIEDELELTGPAGKLEIGESEQLKVYKAMLSTEEQAVVDKALASMNAAAQAKRQADEAEKAALAEKAAMRKKARGG
jgi:hypothetical protein